MRNPGNITAIVFLTLSLFVAHGQVIPKKTPDANFLRNKGMLMVHGAAEGSLYLDNSFMSGLVGNDTVYIINLAPGDHEVKFIAPEVSWKHLVNIGARKVTEIKPVNGLLTAGPAGMTFDDTRELVTGKPVLFLDKAWFNITQVALFSAQFGKSSGGDLNRWLGTITTINGFQVVPGIAAGIGISYTCTSFPTVYDSRSYYSGKTYPQPEAMFENASFLPVFLDVRSHFTGKKVAPFIRFGIGYNLLLAKQGLIVYGNVNSGALPYSIELTGGGIHLSPGAGLRIGLSGITQLILSAEYVYESSKRKLTGLSEVDHSVSPPSSTAINSFRICIGIGFQKK